MVRKYSKKAPEEVKQAVAIGLSEARKKGAKVSKQKSFRKKEQRK